MRGRLRRDYGTLQGLQELVLTVDGTGHSIPSEWGGLKNLQRLVVKCVGVQEWPGAAGGMRCRPRNSPGVHMCCPS